MAKDILFIDNDPAASQPYVAELKDSGYQVTVISTLSEAELAVNYRKYDLLVLDAMMPTMSDEEDKIYHPNNNDYQRKEGVIFYRRTKEHLLKSGTPVLVLTVRLDNEIREAFLKEGLPRQNYSTKLALREPAVFINKVKKILGDN